MSFLSPSWSGFFSKWSDNSQRACGKANKQRSRPKHADKRFGVIEQCENRETISETLFAGAQFAAILGSIPTAEPAADVLSPWHELNVSVSGGSTDAEHTVAQSGTGRLDADSSFSSSPTDFDDSSPPAGDSTVSTAMTVSSQAPSA